MGDATIARGLGNLVARKREKVVGPFCVSNGLDPFGCAILVYIGTDLVSKSVMDISPAAVFDEFNPLIASRVVGFSIVPSGLQIGDMAVVRA